MPKNVMTAGDIDREISELTGGMQGGVPGARSALMQAFTLGQDNGKAIMLEKAEQLMGDNVAGVREGQMGRALIAILAWVEARPGRYLGGCSDGCASMTVANLDESEDGFFSHYEMGKPEEAISKLATWCIEHAVKFPYPAPVADTERPPAEQPTEPNNELPEAAPDSGPAF